MSHECLYVMHIRTSTFKDYVLSLFNKRKCVGMDVCMIFENIFNDFAIVVVCGKYEKRFFDPICFVFF